MRGVSDRELAYEELFAVDEQERHRNKLGTINGVLVPCLLNIMGVILFLRLGWAVGQAGLGGALAMLAVAEVQTILTVLSLSAIVTNGSMKGGGSYYMVSRSLGPELGGAIGVLFYLAYAIGACFYTIGFATELQETYFPQHTSRWFLIGISSLVLAVILFISLVGAKFFTKVNVLIFSLQSFGIVYALFSFWTRRGPFQLSSFGSFHGWSSVNLGRNFWTDFSVSGKCGGQMCTFRKVFAIVFPAATGIMEGANLSGDLKNTKRSLGTGTLIAVLVAMITYVAIIITEAACFDRETLKNNDTIMQETAHVPDLVIMGILISTSSSALGSVFGGSRILQALARDELFPYTKWLGKGSFGADEPRRAVLFTWLIAQCCLFLGNLDVVAPIISSFFCMSYAITNFSAFFLRVSGVPNFRPGFRYFNAWVALAGGILNVAVMFWLNIVYALVSLVFLLLIYCSLLYFAPDVSWGDVKQALLFHQVRKFLLLLDDGKTHGKLWRPSVLLLVDDVQSDLIDFCDSLKKGGLYILGAVVSASETQFSDSIAKHEQIRDSLLMSIQSRHLKAFPQLSVASSLRSGVQNLLLLSGLGALSPNTVVVPSWSELFVSRTKSLNQDPDTPILSKSENKDLSEESSSSMSSSRSAHRLLSDVIQDETEYAEILKDVIAAHKNLVIADGFSSFKTNAGIIDVILTESDLTSSWSEFASSGLAALQLAYILLRKYKQRSSFCDTDKDAGIRVHRLNSRFLDGETTRLQLLVEETRIPVKTMSSSTDPLFDESILLTEDSSALCLNNFIRSKCRDSELVLVSLSPKLFVTESVRNLGLIAKASPATLFVFPDQSSSPLMSREI